MKVRSFDPYDRTSIITFLTTIKIAQSANQIYDWNAM